MVGRWWRYRQDKQVSPKDCVSAMNTSVARCWGRILNGSFSPSPSFKYTALPGWLGGRAPGVCGGKGPTTWRGINPCKIAVHSDCYVQRPDKGRSTQAFSRLTSQGWAGRTIWCWWKVTRHLLRLGCYCNYAASLQVKHGQTGYYHYLYTCYLIVCWVFGF